MTSPLSAWARSSPPLTCCRVLLSLSFLGFCVDTGFLDEKGVLWPEVRWTSLGAIADPHFFPQVLCAYFMECSVLFTCYYLFHRQFCGAVIVFRGWTESPASNPHPKPLRSQTTLREEVFRAFVFNCLFFPLMFSLFCSLLGSCSYWVGWGKGKTSHCCCSISPSTLVLL